MPTIVPVLLAGGEGKRLRPLSSQTRPKQFLKLIKDADDTLLQASARRALMVSNPCDIITIASEKYKEMVSGQLGEIHSGLQENVILEPFGRNTAAAISLAAIHAASKFDDPVLWVIPSDHMIIKPEILKHAITKSINAARHGKIIVFGIDPVRADSNYGYIIGGEQIERYNNLYNVNMFVEKPFGAPLQWALKQNKCWWNSGMFLLSARTLFLEMKRNNNDILQLASDAYTAGRKTQYGITLSKRPYAQIESQPIDKVIMENSHNLAVNPVDIGWSDVGSWQSIWELSQANGGQDPLNNFLSILSKAA